MSISLFVGFSLVFFCCLFPSLSNLSIYLLVLVAIYILLSIKIQCISSLSIFIYYS